MSFEKNELLLTAPHPKHPKRRPRTKHGKHDPAHMMSTELFSTGWRPSLRRRNLVAEYQLGPEERIVFEGPHHLGPEHNRVYQAVVAIMSDAAERKIIEKPAKSRRGEQLRLFVTQEIQRLEKHFALHRQALDGPLGAIQTSLYAIAREGGIDDSQKSLDRIVEILRHMRAVTLTWYKRQMEWGTLFVSYMLDHDTKRLWIIANERIIAAIAGDSRYWCCSDMEEVRAIRHGRTLILHWHLSARVRPGTTEGYRTETLMGYLYAEPAKPGSSTERTRMFRTRAALAEILALLTKNWNAIEYAPDKWRISRKARKKELPS